MTPLKIVLRLAGSVSSGQFFRDAHPEVSERAAVAVSVVYDSSDPMDHSPPGLPSMGFLQV